MMHYEFIHVQSPEPLGTLSKRVKVLSEAIDLAITYRALAGTARNHVKGARDSSGKDPAEIAKQERLAFGAELYVQETRLRLARVACDVQYSVKTACEPPTSFEEM